MAYALEEVAGGLRFPEGPVAMRDGSVIVTEIQGGTLSRVALDGSVSVIAHLGGGPNGAAVGPDQQMYVCNNGGSVWHEHDGFTFPGTATADINETETYSGGRIERVDLQTGRAEVLTRACGDVMLRAPNDLVFDRTGGFWFTDFGKRRLRTRDRTGVLYARPAGDEGGYELSEVLFPLNTPNGIGLSPDEDVLYVAETETGRLWAWDVVGPGQLDLDAYRPWHGRLLGMRCDGAMFDSLAVDSEGNIVVATIGIGGITVFDPGGTIVEVIDTDDPMTTNLCFAGADLRSAYITCAGTGRLLRTRWPHPGLPCAFTG